MRSPRGGRDPPLTQSLLRAELDLFKASLVNEVVERLRAEELQEAGMVNHHSPKRPQGLPHVSPKATALDEGLDEVASQQPLIESGAGHNKVNDENECCQSELWQSAWFQKLSGFVKTNVFESIAGFVVISSILWLMWGTDYKARMWLAEDPGQFIYVETFFLVGFTIEICLRIAVFGIQTFFCGPDRYSGWLDFFLVVIQLTDVLQTVTKLGKGKTRWAPMLRILRMVRILRLGRLFRFFPDLRMLIVSVIQSFQPLVWVFGLISTLTAIFAILITVVVTEYKTLNYVSEDDWNKATDDDSDERNLQMFFGNFGRSTLSLYGAIAGGRDWHESAEPLEACINPYMTYLFAAYTFVVIFAMMNVITSQFVDQTLEASAQDRRESMVSNLMDAFNTDTKQQDLVTEEDFMQNLKHPSMKSFLKDLYKREDVSAEEIQKSRLFEMLDDDGSGEITRDELVLGCVKLTGSATSLDLAVLKLDVEAVRRDVGLLVRRRGEARAPATPA